jgi:hypothetical protein
MQLQHFHLSFILLSESGFPVVQFYPNGGDDA